MFIQFRIRRRRVIEGDYGTLSIGAMAPVFLDYLSLPVLCVSEKMVLQRSTGLITQKRCKTAGVIFCSLFCKISIHLQGDAIR